METNLIRLRDGKTTWIHADGLSAELEELPFKASSSHGQYLSLSLAQRKAAVFPFEIFSVEGEIYYFGPEPSCHQIVRPARIKWIRPSEKYTAPVPGISSTHAMGGLLWLVIRSVLMNLRSQIQRQDEIQIDNRSARFVQHASSAVLAAATLALLGLKPLTLHAPTPSAEQRARNRDALHQIEAVQKMRTALMTQSPSVPQGSLITGNMNSTAVPTKNPDAAITTTPKSKVKRNCSLDERVSAFMSPSQLREHFQRCKSNEE